MKDSFDICPRFAALRLIACILCGTFVLSGQSSLQPVIDAARPGATIVVQPGVYSGNLIITKRLTLIGINRPVLRGSGNGSVITVAADSCLLTGFQIEHSGTMLVNEDAGILIRSDHTIVANNELRDVLFGIYLWQTNHNRIEGNRITGRAELGLGERGAGLHVWNSNFNSFIGNHISDCRDGFYMQNASHTWIERNEVHSLRYGLHYMYADSNTFLRNNFHDNVAGAAVMYSRGIVMRHNVFTRNRGFASYGILFQDCHGMTADSNVVTDNVIGMFLEASTDNIFRHNVIAQNDVALEMFQNSTNNTFSGNNFIDNLSPLTIVGKRTESRWTDGNLGNYWSSYDGYDINQDGIGDVPMKIQNVFSFLEGRQPNLRLYLYSPASQALASATNAFPIIDINRELDERPLMHPVNLSALLPGSRFPEATPLLLRSSLHPVLWLLIPLFVGVCGGALMVFRRRRRSG